MTENLSASWRRLRADPRCLPGAQDKLGDAMAAELDRLSGLVYVPGLWQCAKCTFQLLQGTIHADSGAVTSRDQTGEICPNCETPLWRVTERDAGNRLANDLDKVIADRETMREQLEAGPIAELEGLIVRIDALTLPSYTSDYDRHRDSISRAGIKTEIGQRIRELRTGQPRPTLSAADAFVGAGQMINAAALAEIRADEDAKCGKSPPDKSGWAEMAGKVPEIMAIAAAANETPKPKG